MIKIITFISQKIYLLISDDILSNTMMNIHNYFEKNSSHKVNDYGWRQAIS